MAAGFANPGRRFHPNGLRNKTRRGEGHTTGEIQREEGFEVLPVMQVWDTFSTLLTCSVWVPEVVAERVEAALADSEASTFTSWPTCWLSWELSPCSW